MAWEEGEEVTLGRPGFVSDPPKRGAIYEVTLEALTQILHGRIPSDAQVVQVWWDAACDRLLIKVWGPSLPVVPEADPYERRGLEVFRG